MQQQFDELKAFLQEQFHSIDERFNAIDRRFDAIDQRFDDMDISIFDNTEEIKKLQVADARHEKRLDSLITNIDGFIKLHQTLNLETLANRARSERLEERVERLEKTKTE